MIMLHYILYHILQLFEEFKFICNFANNPEDVFAINWQIWRSKIVKYSRLESKPSMMDHLELLNSATTNELSWDMLLLFPFKFITLVLAHCYVVAMLCYTRYCKCDTVPPCRLYIYDYTVPEGQGKHLYIPVE